MIQHSCCLAWINIVSSLEFKNIQSMQCYQLIIEDDADLAGLSTVTSDYDKATHIMRHYFDNYGIEVKCKVIWKDR